MHNAVVCVLRNCVNVVFITQYSAFQIYLSRCMSMKFIHFHRRFIFQKQLYHRLSPIPPLGSLWSSRTRCCGEHLERASVHALAAPQGTGPGQSPACAAGPPGPHLRLATGLSAAARRLGSTCFPNICAHFSELDFLPVWWSSNRVLFQFAFEVECPFHRFIWLLVQWNVFFCFSTVVSFFLPIQDFFLEVLDTNPFLLNADGCFTV